MDLKLGISEFEMRIFEGLEDMPVLHDLMDPVRDSSYSVISRKGKLERLARMSRIIFVGGGNFGDEGKGKTIDALAEIITEYNMNMGGKGIIVRANSGENAGHTVIHEDMQITFHVAPSGLLRPNTINYMGPQCVVDVVNFMGREIRPLIERGIHPELYIDNVLLVGPYHKLEDLLDKPPNSSTITGMSYAHRSMIDKTGVRLRDLFGDRNDLIGKLKRDMTYYFRMLADKGLTDEMVLERVLEVNRQVPGRIPDHIIDFLKAGNTSQEKAEFLADLYTRTVVDDTNFPKMANVRHELRNAIKKGLMIMVEGAQSYWLSNAVPNQWKYSTSADTTAMGSIASLGLPSSEKYLILNVVKMPGSRVGRGNNPPGYVDQMFFSDHKINSVYDLGDACKDLEGITAQYFRSIRPNGIIEPGVYSDGSGTYTIRQAMAIAESRKFKEFGATTGKPRVLGPLDLVALAEVIEMQGPYLVVSAVDRYDGYSEIPLVVGYVYFDPEGKEREAYGITYKNGDVIRPGDAYPDDEILKHCQPIIKLVPGWQDNYLAAGKRKADSPLPQETQNLLGEIEHFTGAKILAIGNGPNNTDMIYVKRG